VPIGLVSSGDTKTGAAIYNWSVNIGNNNSQSLTIGIIVNNYYTRNSSDDDAVVTVSKPLSDFITGGGCLMLSSSSGLKAGAAGSRNNFGFNVKWNKGGTNLQGNINTIVRNGGLVYQIKGNSMTSLSVNAAAGTAVFNGKASIQDITNPLSPLSIDGNATLQVAMTDKGEPGTSDLIGITVWNKSGGLWFSSNWNGTTTVQQVLAGGNLSAKSGGATTALVGLAPTDEATGGPAGVDGAPREFALAQNVPNPFARGTSIRFELPEKSRVRVDVFDILGRRVAELANGEMDAQRYEVNWAGRDAAGRSAGGGRLLRQDGGSLARQ